MDVRTSYTVNRIKVMIWHRCGVHQDMQDLSCHGNTYEDSMMLSDYDIQNGDVLRLCLRSALVANADCDYAPHFISIALQILQCSNLDYCVQYVVVCVCFVMFCVCLILCFSMLSYAFVSSLLVLTYILAYICKC